jgi:hypothetical protein
MIRPVPTPAPCLREAEPAFVRGFCVKPAAEAYQTASGHRSPVQYRFLKAGDCASSSLLAPLNKRPARSPFPLRV